MMWGINMKKIILIFILVLIILMFPTQVFAENEEIMTSTQEKFNINSFLKDAKEYTGDFFEDVSITDMFNEAVQGKINNQTIYKKILKLLGQEVTSSLKVLISILVIIVIHGILKSITDSLENNNVSQIIYFVQYILIVTLIMSNFTEIIELVRKTANDLVGFINVLIPLLLTLMVYIYVQLSNTSILMDASKYIKELKQKVVRLNKEITCAQDALRQNRVHTHITHRA